MARSRSSQPGRIGRVAATLRAPRLRDRAGALEQRHLDLIALVLLAFAVYLGLVLYGGWDGGQLGTRVADGLELGLGAPSFAFPAALAAIGAMLVLRPLLPGVIAPWAGLGALGAGVTLAYAAQTAGLGPSGERPPGEMFDPELMRAHGGLIGEILYWATVTLFQRAGAHIAAVALCLAGVLLLSGSEIAATLSRMATLARRASAAVGGRHATRTGEPGSVADGEDRLETEGLTLEEPPDMLGAATTEVWQGPEEPEGAEPTVVRGEEGGIANYDASLAGAQEGQGESAAEVPPEKPGEDERTPMGKRRSGVTESEELEFSLPDARSALRREGPAEASSGTDNQDHVARALLEALGHFGVEARLIGVVSGPSVSRYELRLAPGTKVAKVSQLQDDLAYALASTDIRILAPIPGKQAVGVEVPNAHRRMVRLGDIYGGRPEGSSPLACWLGKDIAGNAVWTDLARMPHVLAAGTTGSGKSGCLNSVLSSILLHATPNEVRLVLVDPKQVELNHYERVPHLLTPVVTNPRVAAMVLENLVSEMENRYGLMREARARSLPEFNKARLRAGEPPLPYVLCMIDELADLMMVAPAEVEDSIIRLAQKSRAVGIHLLLATQRPSTDIITGTIKVNIPARIAFGVSSQVDSRVILDQGGAEALLGQGDMLFRPVGSSKLQRIQGAFITEEEIARIIRHWTRQGEPEFDEELLREPPEPEAGEEDRGFDPDEDDLLDEAIRLVVEQQSASVSGVQRQLRVGYTRAGRLIDMLERRGVISGYEGSKPRQVLATPADLPRLLDTRAGDAEESLDTDPERSGDPVTEEPDATEGPPEGVVARRE